jgi:hypothetical protein
MRASVNHSGRISSARSTCRGAQSGNLGGSDELQGIVGVAATDHYDRVAFRDELSKRELPILRRLTDGIAEANFRMRARCANSGDQLEDRFNRLGCL